MGCFQHPYPVEGGSGQLIVHPIRHQERDSIAAAALNGTLGGMRDANRAGGDAGHLTSVAFRQKAGRISYPAPNIENEHTALRRKGVCQQSGKVVGGDGQRFTGLREITKVKVFAEKVSPGFGNAIVVRYRIVVRRHGKLSFLNAASSG
jgi:hypothetical protein